MTDKRTTDRVDHSPRVRDAIDELMHKKDATTDCIACDGKVMRPRTLCTDFVRKEKDKVKR